MARETLQDRLKRYVTNLPEETSPEEELAESREVAAAGEIPGHLLAHHLEIPEELGPEWAPLLLSMRVAMADEIGDLIEELVAQGHPEPLLQFGQATAVDGVPTVIRFPAVPVKAVWEVTNLWIHHPEGAAVEVAISSAPGGVLEEVSVATDVGTSPDWSGPLYLRAGLALEVSAIAGALTEGNRLEAALFGRLHSTRSISPQS